MSATVLGRTRRVFGVIAVIVTAAALFTCTDKENSPVGPNIPGGDDPVATDTLPPYALGFGDIPSGFLSMLGGKIGTSLADKALHAIGLGAIAEFLGLSGDRALLEEMNGKLTQLLDEVDAINQKLGLISAQVEAVGKLVKKEGDAGRAWTTISNFSSKIWGPVYNTNSNTLISLKNIRGDYAKVLEGTKTPEDYNTGLGTIMRPLYRVDNPAYYETLTEMARVMMGQIGDGDAPGMARYLLETTLTNNNPQTLLGYFNFVNRMVADFSLGVLLCSGAMKFEYEQQPEGSTNRTKISGEMENLKNLYLEVIRYYYDTPNYTEFNPKPEFVYARVTYEDFPGNNLDDYVYFYNAMPNVKADAAGAYLKTSIDMLTVGKDFVSLKPGDVFPITIRHQAAAYKNIDWNCKVTSWNTSVAAVNGLSVIASSPGFARIVVSSEKGVATFFVYVMNSGSDNDHNSADAEIISGGTHTLYGEGYPMALANVFLDIDADDIGKFKWQTKGNVDTLTSEDGELSVYATKGTGSGIIYGYRQLPSGGWQSAQATFVMELPIDTKVAVSTAEQLLNALDSNKNITLVNNIDLTPYGSKARFTTVRPRDFFGFIPGDGRQPNNLDTYFCPTATETNFNRVLDGNDFTIIMPYGVLLPNIGVGGVVKNLNLYYSDYYSKAVSATVKTREEDVQCVWILGECWGKGEELEHSWQVWNERGFNALTVENRGKIENVTLRGVEKNSNDKSANIMIAAVNHAGAEINLCFNVQKVTYAGGSINDVAWFDYCNLHGQGEKNVLNRSASMVMSNLGNIYSSGVDHCIARRKDDRTERVVNNFVVYNQTKVNVFVYHNSGLIRGSFIRGNGGSYKTAAVEIKLEYRESNCSGYGGGTSKKPHRREFVIGENVTITVNNTGRVENSFAFGWGGIKNDYVGAGRIGVPDDNIKNCVWGKTEAEITSAAVLATLNTSAPGLWVRGSDGTPRPSERESGIGWNW